MVLDMIGRQVFSFLFVVASCFLFSPPVFAQELQAVPDRYVIGFETGWAERLRAITTGLDKYSDQQIKAAIIIGLGGTAEVEGELDLIDAQLAIFENGSKLDTEYAWRLIEVGILKYVEPDYLVKLSEIIPNDPYYSRLWALLSRSNDVDIDAPEAWEITTGSSEVVVGVVDTGIDWTHKDLQANMWRNLGETINGIDDDGNGYVDDYYGWNSISDSWYSRDDHSHGTHCAGTIGATGNNNMGLPGVNWNVKLMSLKFLGANGWGSYSDAIQVIDYAIKQKKRGVNLRVLSNSWGGSWYSHSLYEAIVRANNAEILFVAAAGNDNKNNDSSASYPANYNVPNVISVAAVDSAGRRASFSNYGKRTVDLGAPGVSIFSTVRGGSYAYYSGTSMATPHVSGVAALMVGLRGDFSALQLKESLLANTKPLPSLSNITVTGGMLSAYRALVYGTTLPPSIEPIEDQVMSHSEDTRTIELSVSDPEDDPLTITAEALIASSQLVELDRQYNMSHHGGYNLSGYGEKWINGSEDSIFWILPGGNLFRYQEITLEYLTNVGHEVYIDPSLLYDAANSLPPVTVSVSDSTLLIDPQEDYIGTFNVKVSVSDGTYTVERIFSVRVENVAPVFSDIEDRAVSHRQVPVEIIVSATDPENDPITFSAYLVSETPEYLLDKQYDFVHYSSEHFNILGAQEKYVSDSRLRRYFILPGGEVYRLNTGLSDSTLIGTVNPTTYDNPEFLVHPELSPEIPASVRISQISSTTAQLVISTTDFYVGVLHVTVEADDGVTKSSKTFTVDLTNAAPEISPIGDQTMTSDTPSLELVISVSDADGDPVTLSASVNTSEQLAYELDQEYDFGLQGGTYYTNLRGQGEKYLYTEALARWYVIMPNGRLYIWTGSFDTMTLIGVLPVSYYEDPSLLFDVQPPADNLPAEVTLDGTTLTITPKSGYLGTFSVRVSADDGWTKSWETFNVRRVNSPPELLPIPHQSHEKSLGELSVELEATDIDNDPLTFSATVSSQEELLYRLDQQHDFGVFLQGNYYTNMRGKNEKYLYSASSGNWYVLLPDGKLYLWGGNFEKSTLLAALPISYYLEPTKLFDLSPASGPPVATATISGNSLTLTPQQGFCGSFQVTVTVSDGELTDSENFTVTCTNVPPVLEQPQDLTLYSADRTATVELIASDGDGDPLTFSARLSSLAHLVYRLDQEHDFSVHNDSYYTNLRGEEGKYLYSFASGNWYTILPDGKLYFLDGSFKKTNLLARLPEEYYQDPSLLIDAPLPQEQPPASFSVTGNSLTITLAPEYTGTFFVEALVSDSIASDHRQFSVTVLADTTDSDGDGVDDLEEIDQGSDPFDAGSFLHNLRSPIFALWNSFLEMINILELVNPYSQDKSVLVTLYAMDGTRAHQQLVTIPAQSQFDLILNELPGFSNDSYGIVKLEFEGIIDGRMFYYRTTDNFSTYEFAFGIPLANANYGRTAVGFNTFQPSFNLADAEHVVRNWLTVVNLSEEEKVFTVTSYGQHGEELLTRELIIPAFGRTDVDGGHDFAGPSVVGLHTILPRDLEAPYIAQLTRYGGAAPANVLPGEFRFAFPLISRAGTGRTVNMPISNQFTEQNWVEVINTLDREVQVHVRFLNTQGELLDQQQQVFPPFGQHHFNATRLLQAGESGIAVVSSSAPNSLISQSMFYFRNAYTGSIDAMYGSQAREALSRVVFGSYNLFLDMENWLKVVNTSASEKQIQILVHSQDTTSETLLDLAPHGSAILPIHDTAQFHTAADTYGTIEARITDGAYIFAELLRIRPYQDKIDFAAPTVVR